MRYFAIDSVGQNGLLEVLVVREQGRQVSQERTGVVYGSMREASAALRMKNVPAFCSGQSFTHTGA